MSQKYILDLQVFLEREIKRLQKIINIFYMIDYIGAIITTGFLKIAFSLLDFSILNLRDFSDSKLYYSIDQVELTSFTRMKLQNSIS